MQAMRRRARKLLAALLCTCLLVSYSPLPASAAEDPYAPSVSDEMSNATMTGKNEAQVSTTVNVLAVPALAITGQTMNYAATIDQIAADPGKYDLEVSVTGRPPFTYSWSRSVDGVQDSGFAYDKGPSYPLSKHTDTLEYGRKYGYKVEVGDQSGKTVEAQIEVTVSSAYGYDSLEKDGVKVSASKHWKAEFSIESLPENGPTYNALQEAAGGAAMAGAWLIGIGGAPDGKDAFVGDARVELPLTGVEDGAEIVVVGLDSSGKPVVHQAARENGKAVFDTSTLGAFALAWKKAVPPHTIKASVEGGNGQIDPKGDVEVADGDDKTFAFAPDNGYKVGEVKVDGRPVAEAEVANNRYTFRNVTRDHTISVSFAKVVPEPVLHKVSASVSGGHGTVSVEGGAFGASAEASVEHGEPAVVAFLPESGYVVDGITVKVGAAEPVEMEATSANELSISAVEDDTHVAVTFKSGSQPPSKKHTITAAAEGGGTVEPASQEVAHGASCQFTVTPAAGHRLAALTFGGEDVMGKFEGDELGGGTVVLDAVFAGGELRAVFEPVPAELRTVTASVDGIGGVISPAGDRQVAAGTSLAFYLHPDVGFKLKSLMLAEGGAAAQDVTARVNGGVFALDDVRADYELTASFEESDVVVPEGVYYTVSATAGEGGSLSPAGSVRVKAGGSQTFHFLPATGYKLKSVMVDGVQVAVSGLSYTLLGVAANSSVEASFEPVGEGSRPDVPETHDIAATAGSGGTVSPSGAVPVLHGGSMSFAFIPYAGYELAAVHVDDEPLGPEVVARGSHRFDNVVEDHKLHAAFKAKATAPEDPLYHTVAASAGKGGAISPSGAARVRHGASQTFSLIPDAGYAVESVTVDGEPVTVSGTSYTLFNVESDRAVSVSFKKEEGAKPPAVHKVSASSTAGGEVAPEGDVAVVEGAALSVSFLPYEGYELYRVTVDGKDLADEETAKGFYRFSDVRDDHAIRAFFARKGTEPDPDDPDKPVGYTVIDASAGANGSIEPQGRVKVELGASQTFTFQPDEGYAVDAVTVDGQPVTVSGLTYTFEGVRAGGSINVTFKKEGAGPAPAVRHLEASATAGGSIEPSGRIPVDDGVPKTFAIKADAGFELAYLLVDGSTVPAAEAAGGSYTFEEVRANHAIRAVFRAKGAAPVQPTYAVVHAAATAGGSISPAGDVRVAKGGGYTFVMLPFDGYKLQDVTVNGASALDRVRDGCRLALEGVDEETEVLATFAELGGDPAPVLPKVHAVHATSTSGGSIVPRTYVQVVDGDSVSFAVTPDEGFRLAKLVVDGADVPASEAAEGTFTLRDVRGDRSVRAAFERAAGSPPPGEPFYVNADVELKVLMSTELATGGGSVQPAFISVPRGSKNLPFYAYPEEGHALKSVSVNGKPVPFQSLEAGAPHVMASRAAVFAASAPGAAGAYQFVLNEAREDVIIEVTFYKLAEGERPPAPVQMHRVEASAAPGGAITPGAASSVPHGAPAVFGVKPDAGFRLASLLVTEGGVQREAKGEVAGGLLVLPDVRGDVSVRAAFEPAGSGPVVPEYVVVHAVAGGHGTVSPSGDVRVKRGEGQTFSFVPAKGYTLDKVYVDGVERAAERCSLTLGGLDADAELRATFRPIESGDPQAPAFRDVTLKSNAGGRVDPSGVVQVADGKSLAVMLTPDEGHEAVAVKANGKDLPRDVWADGFFQLENVTEPLFVEVTFAKTTSPPSGKVRVTPRAGRGGSISPSEPFDVDKGTDVQFSLVPEAGYVVDRVLVNGVAVESSGTSYTLYEVAEDTVVLALFKEEGGAPPAVVHTISASAGLHGSIVPSGPQRVVHGNDQLFVFQPEAGYVVDVLEVDGKRVENPGERYLFKRVEGDHAIHVTFRVKGADPAPPDERPVHFAIEAGVSGGHGRISPSGTVLVERGKARTFDFLPDAGYAVSALVIDGERMAFGGNRYRFVDVQANHTIEVVFAPAPAPAPTDPADGASRVAWQVVGYVKTGDANGALACAALALAGVAACAALMARRRMAEASAAAARTASDRGERR